MDTVTDGQMFDAITKGLGSKPTQLRAMGLNVHPVPSTLDAKVKYPIMLWPEGEMVITAYETTQQSCPPDTKRWTRTFNYELDSTYFPPRQLSAKKWHPATKQGVLVGKWSKQAILEEKWQLSKTKAPGLLVFSDDYAVSARLEIREALGSDGAPIAYLIDRNFALVGMDLYLDMGQLVPVKSDNQLFRPPGPFLGDAGSSSLRSASTNS
jgi:hypothetical protein